MATFASAAVQSIAITTADSGMITVDNAVLQPTTIQAGSGQDVIRTGGGPTTVDGGTGPDKLIAGSGPATLIGGTGQNVLYAGSAPDTLVGGPGRNEFFHVKPADTVVSNPGDQIFPGRAAGRAGQPERRPADAPGKSNQLLQRASAADAADNAIVAIVDRGGNLLGVRVEANVSPQITVEPRRAQLRHRRRPGRGAHRRLLRQRRRPADLAHRRASSANRPSPSARSIPVRT